MYFFVSRLFPLSRSCSGNLFRESPHVPPVLLQTAIMCLSAAQRDAEWGLFSTPPNVNLTQLVTGGAAAQTFELNCL